MSFKKLISIVMIVALMATLAVGLTGCGSKKPAEPTIPACKEGMEHDWTVTVFRKVTCLESGLEKHVCKNCEFTERVSVPALGHQFENNTDGITSCVHCGLIKNPEAILTDDTTATTEPLIPIE